MRQSGWGGRGATPRPRRGSAWRTTTGAKRPVWLLAGDATTLAVKQHLRDLASHFERLAEGVEEDASG